MDIWNIKRNNERNILFQDSKRAVSFALFSKWFITFGKIRDI